MARVEPVGAGGQVWGDRCCRYLHIGPAWPCRSSLVGSWVLAHGEASFSGVLLTCPSLFQHLLTPQWWGLSLGLQCGAVLAGFVICQAYGGIGRTEAPVCWAFLRAQVLFGALCCSPVQW